MDLLHPESRNCIIFSLSTVVSHQGAKWSHLKVSLLGEVLM